jgi:Phosphoinositide 3-kinase family, accessory domain (PIK domain)
MDVEDALELLSPNFSHPAVRKYAVSRLSQAPDEVIFPIKYRVTRSRFLAGKFRLFGFKKLH